MNLLEVKIKTPAEAAETCRKALELETKNDALQRSTVEIQHDGGSLILRIQASDLTALRASMNTYLRWLGMCLQLVEEKQDGTI